MAGSLTLVLTSALPGSRRKKHRSFLLWTCTAFLLLSCRLPGTPLAVHAHFYWLLVVKDRLSTLSLPARMPPFSSPSNTQRFVCISDRSGIMPLFTASVNLLFTSVNAFFIPYFLTAFFTASSAFSYRTEQRAFLPHRLLSYRFFISPLLNGSRTIASLFSTGKHLFE